MGIRETWFHTGIQVSNQLFTSTHVHDRRLCMWAAGLWFHFIQSLTRTETDTKWPVEGNNWTHLTIEEALHSVSLFHLWTCCWLLFGVCLSITNTVKIIKPCFQNKVWGWPEIKLLTCCMCIYNNQQQCTQTPSLITWVICLQSRHVLRFAALNNNVCLFFFYNRMQVYAE